MHDMALIILDKPVPTQVNVRTICLYCDDFQLQNSTEVTFYKRPCFRLTHIFILRPTTLAQVGCGQEVICMVELRIILVNPDLHLHIKVG